MRVADQQIYGTLLGNLQRSRQQILEAQQQISSQKKVAEPSDDPAAFGQIVLDKASLSQTDQWIRNIQFGTARVEAADSALQQAQNVVTRIRELTIQASDARGVRHDAEFAFHAALAAPLAELEDEVVGDFIGPGSPVVFAIG